MRKPDVLRLVGCAAVVALLSACATDAPDVVGSTRNQVIISVRDQKLTVITPDHHRVTFPISTSKFGLGDRRGSLATPLGEMEVAQKIGAGAPAGSVFRSRVRTGEIVRVDAPGRDAIVTRILALKGLEAGNQGAYARGIYIHGTPEERNIGRPSSYGCIRMRSRDVIQLYDMVGVGAHVQIIDTTMPRALAANIVAPSSDPAPQPAAVPTPDAVTKAAGLKPPSANATLVASTPPPPTVQPPPAATTATKQALAAAVSPKPAARKEWAGSPSKLLQQQAQAEAKAKKTRPVGGTPVSNTGSDAGVDNGYGSRSLGRSAIDSL